MVIKRNKQDLKDSKCRSLLSKKKIYVSFIFGLLGFSLLLFTFLADPVIMLLKEYTRVTPGSFVHQLMMREMEGIHLSTYLFNITNSEEFMSGEHQKLKIEEVGPFTYREMRSNLDIEINTETERLTYTPKIRLEYMVEESIGRPEDINVTVPNIPMLGLATTAGQFSYWTGLGFNMLSNQVNSKPIITLNGSNYMWGYNEPLISLAHTAFPGLVHFDKMGILDRIYDKKNLNRIEVSIADQDRFMIKSLNGHKKLRMGQGDPDNCELCNTLENVYEGVGYPFGLTPEFTMRIFKNGLCRILDLYYYETVHTDFGSDALVYHFSDNFFKLHPNDSNNGVLALPECFFGVPLAFSKPHFLGSDPSVYEHIEGIKPDAERYKGWVSVEPKLGLTLETEFSVQLNLVMGDVSTNTKAKRLSNMVLPICYLKISQPPLPEESMIFLNGIYVTGPYVMLGFQVLLSLLVVVCWGYFLRAMYLNFIMKEDTMTFPVGTIKEINANNIEEPLMITPQKVESGR